MASLLLCAPSAGYVHLSVINGHVVVKDGQLLTIDLAKLVAEGEAATEELCKGLDPAVLGRQ